MMFTSRGRLVVFPTVGLTVRTLGDGKLWLSNPARGPEWIAAEEPCDLRSWA